MTDPKYDTPQDHEDLPAGDLEGFEQDAGSSTEAKTDKLVKLRLIQRPHMTTLALPRSPTWPSEVVPLNQTPWHFVPNVLSYAKFMLANSNYMVHELEREVQELLQERANLRGDEVGISFVDVALIKVRGQIEKAKTELDTPALRRMEREARDGIREIQESRERERRQEEERKAAAHGLQEELQTKAQRLEANAEHFMDAGDQSATPRPSTLSADAPTFVMSSAGAAAPVKATKNKPKRNLNPSHVPPSSYWSADQPSHFYYQVDGGANVYLSPLDSKILLSHYKSYAALPDVIHVVPEGADEGSMNEELRKRCKYLTHLQLCTNVVFLEADLEQTLGHDAVAAYETPLKRRRDRKKEKTKKEDRAKTRWEAQERLKAPHFVPPTSPTLASQTGSQYGAESLDEELLLALERSNMETGPTPASTSSSPTARFTTPHQTQHVAANIGQGAHGLSPGATSVNSVPGVWGASPENGRSFAAALHALPGSRPPYEDRRKDRELDEAMSQAWSDFERNAAAARDTPEADGEKPPGKPSKKNRKKVVISMGGGGGGRRG